MSALTYGIIPRRPLGDDAAPRTELWGAEHEAVSNQKILSVSSVRRDHTALRRILIQTPWHIASARTCRQAIKLLRRQPFSVILCASDLPDGTWRDLLHRIADAHEPPLMIVTSRLEDEHLWAEVLNLGGYDVLAKPFHDKEVRHVLTSAGNRIEGRNHAGLSR